VWKKYQKQNKQSRQIKLAFLALGFLLLLLLVAKLFSVFSSLFQPFNSAIDSSKKYSWDGSSSINVLIYGPRISLINLHPQNKNMTILHISDDVFMELPKGYGSWKVGSIYDLGQEEKPQIGSNLLKLSISKLVGLPIDGLIIQKDLSQPSVEDLVGGWRKNPFNRLTFLRSISTDLTPIELYKFIKSSSSVRPDQITSLNLAQSNITRSQLLPDSSRVLGVDTIKLDTFIRDNISDPTLSEEDLTLAIFNATPHPGLAQQAQRIMTNLGMNVIILANTEKVLEKSLVLSKEDKLRETVTFKKSAQFFAPSCIKKTCISNDSKIDSSRAQITIVLGEDFYNLWYSK